MGKFFVSTFENMILGGGETYYFRMVDWFTKNGYKSLLILPDDAKIDAAVKKEINKRQIRILNYAPFCKCRFLNSIVHDNDTIVGIVFSFERYLLLNSFMGNRFKDKHLFFYVLWWGRGILEKDDWLSRKILKKCIAPLINEKAYVALDEETREICSSYMGIELQKIPIVKLGMPVKLNDSVYSKENRPFIVLTVCRFDFPFKGYVLGLIKDYAKFASSKESTELWIVGSGDGYSEVEHLIEKYKDQNIKIKLFGQVEYSKLQELYKQASLYVGMGTTVLEAVSEKKLAVVASAYQIENYSSGFYGESTFLGGPISGRFSKYMDIETCKKHKFIQLLDRAYQMDVNEYNAAIKIGYDLYLTYDMDNVMGFFVDSNNGRKVKQSLFTYAYFKNKLLIFKLHHLSRVLKQKFKERLCKL